MRSRKRLPSWRGFPHFGGGRRGGKCLFKSLHWVFLLIGSTGKRTLQFSIAKRELIKPLALKSSFKTLVNKMPERFIIICLSNSLIAQKENDSTI
ncbi:unnamed protein product [Caretta caretta]